MEATLLYISMALKPSRPSIRCASALCPTSDSAEEDDEAAPTVTRPRDDISVFRSFVSSATFASSTLLSDAPFSSADRPID